MMSDDLTHFDDAGRARMVDISEKPPTTRRAVASARVVFSREAYASLAERGAEKGDVARIAEVAGIMAAKRVADLIPLCHPLPLSGVSVTIERDDECAALIVTTAVKTTGPTGVEMEAMTAASVACLAIYDMTKSLDKSIMIESVRLLEKSGGKSGDFKRA